MKVIARGTLSKQWLSDSVLTAGAPVTVVVDSGGWRVGKLHIGRALAARGDNAT